jgi:hypothetical protein
MKKNRSLALALPSFHGLDKAGLSLDLLNKNNCL